MFVRFPWNLSEYYSPQNTWSLYNLHLILYMVFFTEKGLVLKSVAASQFITG